MGSCRAINLVYANVFQLIGKENKILTEMIPQYKLAEREVVMIQ
jgi:hypothetical protein